MSSGDGDSTTRARAWRWVAAVAGVLVLATGAVWIDAATWDRDRVAAVGVCEDVASGLRVTDQRCATGQRGVRWVYYDSGSTAPGVGSSALGGSTQAPTGSGSVARGGEAESGGEVSDEGSSGSSGSSGAGSGEGGEEGGSSGGSSGGGSSGGGSGGGGGGGGGE